MKIDAGIFRSLALGKGILWILGLEIIRSMPSKEREENQLTDLILRKGQMGSGRSFNLSPQEGGSAGHKLAIYSVPGIIYLDTWIGYASG